MIARTWASLVVIACLAILGIGIAGHPFWPFWPAPLAGIVAVVAWFMRGWWIALYLAILPVLDLAPYSGRMFFDEFDYATLAVLASTYSRHYLFPPNDRIVETGAFGWSKAPAIVILLYMGSLVASAMVAILPLAPLDANAFSNLYSPYNALRLAKAPTAVVLLVPIVWQELRVAPRAASRGACVGILAGLALACATVLWERNAFVELTDLSSEFRATGWFSSTNTGGAALDAYIAMTIPFCVAALLSVETRVRFACLAGLLVLGAYAALVTFARSLYVALAIAVACQVFVLSWAANRVSPRRALMHVGLAAGIGILAYVLLGQVFNVAGYRGMIAVAVCLLAQYLLSATPMRVPEPKAALALGAGLIILFALYVLSPRSAYASFAVLSTVQMLLLFGNPARREVYGWACALVLSCCAILVSLAWGGNPALGITAVSLGVAWGTTALNLYMGSRLWRVSTASLPVVLLGGGGLALAVVISHSWFASSRFETVADDWSGRVRHWQDVAAAMDPGARAFVFGMGVGRMPEVYFWRSAGADMSGNFTIADQDGNRFLRLFGGRYVQGYGDPVRVMQHVSVLSPRIRVEMDIRGTTPATTLEVSVCARHIIYSLNCVGKTISVAADSSWHRQSVELDTSAFVGRGLLAAPTFVVLATETQKSFLDIDNIEVSSLFGETLRNGNFVSGMDFWFFTSDRTHLSWHAKNLFLHVMFEQGSLGLGLLIVTLVVAFARLRKPLRAKSSGAVAVLGGLIGFLCVGMFDSLLDAPRVAFLFYALLFCAVAIPGDVLFRSTVESGDKR